MSCHTHRVDAGPTKSPAKRGRVHCRGTERLFGLARALIILVLGAFGSMSMLTANLGCAPPKERARKDVLVVFQKHQTAWIRNFNPLAPPGSAHWVAKAGMYEPLLIWNTMSSSYVPWLATHHEWSDDHLTLRFRLRSGVSWSDGHAFDTGDVRFTFELLRDNPALDHFGIWKFIRSVEQSGPDEVAVHFSRPFIPGMYFIAHQTPIIAEHIWREVQDPLLFTNENPVGTGPFTQVGEFRSQVFQVDRNPRYWNGAEMGIAGLRFPAYVGNDQSNLAILSGEVDWAGDFIPAIDRIFVGRDPKHHHYWFPLIQGAVFLYANTTRPPFDDVRVRKALSMGIDRERIVRIAVHGYTRPSDATALSDAYSQFHDPAAARSGDWTQFDPKRANALLDAAGLPRGPDGMRRDSEGLVLSYEINVVTGWSDYVTTAQIIARGYRSLGIDARIKAYDFGAWYEKLQKGEFDLSMGWSEEGPTPYAFYRGLMSNATLEPVGKPAARNWQRYGNTEADTILEAIEATSDQSQLREHFSRLQQLFVEEAPAIPLFPVASWGEYNDRYITGFPNADDPYAILTPHKVPQALLVLTRLRPR